jgi:tRNA1(Val) A37 N6-methylase TrmN6
MSETTEGTLLGGRVRYRQFATGHRSGFEPVLLAAAVPARSGDKVLELGTGAGAALLCLAARVPGMTGTGVEIDPALAALANENFRINGFNGVAALAGDAGAEEKFATTFDHVLANPPWHDAAGAASPDAKRALAHQAAPGLLDRWIATMADAVTSRGTLTLIIPASSYAAAVAALEAQKFRCIALFPLWPRAGQAAKQVIVQARRTGPSRVLPGLVLHDETGITPAADAVLRSGAGLDLR